MAFSEQEKKKFKAIIRRLRKEKGLRIYKHELDTDLLKLKKAQQSILEIKEANKDHPNVLEEADKSVKKLQGIIDDINEYMTVLHPDGLIDIGGDTNTPQNTIVVSG